MSAQSWLRGVELSDTPSTRLDRERYAADGYLVVPDLIDSATCARLRDEALRFAARTGPAARALAVDTQLVHRSAIIREFVTRGPQVALATELLGPNVCFTHQQFVIKYPDERGRTFIPWHQDNGYGRLDPPRDLTVWIALDDCNLDNGCLWVLPGSERSGLRDHVEMHGLRGVAIDADGVALPMRAGTAALFGSLLMHRSLSNTTHSPRVALYLRYCDPSVTMVETQRNVLEDGHSWMVAGEAP